MNYKSIFKLSLLLTGIVLFSSCKKFLDINKDPDRIPADNAPLAQLLTHSQINLAFTAGSDLYRYTAIIAQHMSGQASQPNQTYEYDRYNITGSDQNNVWSSLYATTLSDLEIIIAQAGANGSPYYAGVAKIMKAYTYHIMVDTWGDIPFTEAQKLTDNLQPAYDDDATIYPKLITMLTEAVTDLNAASSVLVPGANSLIYPGNFTTTKANWIKLANTLKLRLFLHYSKVDPAYMLAQITALVNTAGIQFFSSNADNFQMAFINAPNNRNPIAAFEVSRADYLFAPASMVTLMNTRNDPRRATYFTPFPWASTSYKGVAPGDPSGINYSRIHTFLRGAATGTPVPNAQGGITAASLTYTGAAPIRMLTFAEYNFIRAEAALRGAPGDAQTFFTAGITASMQEAGVAAADITTYLAANGTLTGTFDEKLKRIIEEKYIANFGVILEPWTDWRRTGYPTLAPVSNRMPEVTSIPRSLFYPQSEIDLNPSAPVQKPNDLQTRVFWDTP
jgi:hypothetical protein